MISKIIIKSGLNLLNDCLGLGYMWNDKSNLNSRINLLASYNKDLTTTLYKPRIA